MCVNWFIAHSTAILKPNSLAASTMSSPERNKVFISYSHEDEEWVERLQVHLKPLMQRSRLNVWDDTQLMKGVKWNKEIKKAIDTAKVAVLLISADFLASDFIAENELPPIIEAAKEEGLIVLPVLISPSRFRDTRSLSQFQAFNDPDKPLITLPKAEQDVAWVKLAEEIGRIINEALQESRVPIVLERVEIRNFKNFESLELDFTKPSSLGGNWTCIAGINGAGKTSILQAICLLLLGEDLIPELGGTRLRQMLRRTADGHRENVELKADVSGGSEPPTLFLPLSEKGVDSKKLWNHSRYAEMRGIWERLQKQLLVSFGVTRNISDYTDTRHSSLSHQVRCQMSLFDPFTQITSPEVLLEEDDAYAPVRRTLFRLIQAVLSPDELEVVGDGPFNTLRFTQAGIDVEAIDLPDGFRSTVAWLTELCLAWHESAPPEETQDSDLAKMTGIVLLDEIDLHLHPSLQRTLVPRLRKALPKVQFIVTTHSPLILSSFDQAELVVLDRAYEGGKRPLDRQIFGFTPDQVYEWLMNTPAQSTVLDEKLEQGDDPNLLQYLYQSDHVNEKEAEKRVGDLEDFLKNLPQKS